LFHADYSAAKPATRDLLGRDLMAGMSGRLLSGELKNYLWIDVLQRETFHIWKLCAWLPVTVWLWTGPRFSGSGATGWLLSGKPKKTATRGLPFFVTRLFQPGC